MGYDIQNKDIRNKEIGNLECPFLLAISPGQRNFKSLIFHIKIGFDYYQCHKNVFKSVFKRCTNKIQQTKFIFIFVLQIGANKTGVLFPIRLRFMRIFLVN